MPIGPRARPPSPDFPIAVLVNRSTASASEIVAACLQDHDRAIVVGERSYGKGTVQEVVDMGHTFGAMKLTIATYWRPSGQNINRPKEDAKSDAKNAAWGVSPNEGYDVPVEDDERDRLLALAAGARIGRTQRRKRRRRRRSAGPRAAESRRVLGSDLKTVGCGRRALSQLGRQRPTTNCRKMVGLRCARRHPTRVDLGF